MNNVGSVPTFVDNHSYRFIINKHNQKRKNVTVINTTESWNFGTNSNPQFAESNGGVNHTRGKFLVEEQSSFEYRHFVIVTQNGLHTTWVRLSIDGVATEFSTTTSSNNSYGLLSGVHGVIDLSPGYHYYTTEEKADYSYSTVWGTNNSAGYLGLSPQIFIDA
jgi:hypothetical protein